MTMLAGLAADRSAIEIWDVNRKSRLGRLTTPLNGEPLLPTGPVAASDASGTALSLDGGMIAPVRLTGSVISEICQWLQYFSDISYRKDCRRGVGVAHYELASG
ncbi:hypothetical protein E1287_33595 [Actinomadura sp. KC06]|uniref:hypothetical protein n=1 Tax=Actinomadura sp. KC06 TaxID=2530369 RepID=UPI00104F9810|nr:hypothetical protein [Actinomadura sp. KC06]TDD27975.1 hypothetical protein E1287_33595 [Actinomadura sp. KC06]